MVPFGQQRKREKERNKIAPKESRDRSGEARQGEARREIDSYRSKSSLGEMKSDKLSAISVRTRRILIERFDVVYV